MWAVLLQLAAIGLGWQAVRLLPWRWRRVEAIAASIAIGFVVSAWLFFVFALVLGWPIALPLVTVLLIFASVLSLRYVRPRYTLNNTPYVRTQGWRRWLVWLTTLGVTMTISYLVFLSYQFPVANGAWISNSNVWGDGPLHVTLANQFAHGDSVDLASSLYKKVLLTYPPIADFWSGVLLRLSNNWYVSLMLPSLAMTAALLQLLFSFGYRLLGSTRAAWLAWLMIVFSGSLNGAIVLSQVLFTKGLEAYHNFVSTSITVATGDDYLNFIHSHAIPQRAFLFGMPIAIVVMMGILEFYRFHQNKKKQTQHNWREAAVIIGVLAGLLPLVHTHSFMVMVGIIVLATIGLWLKFKHVFDEWLIIVGITAMLSIPQIVWQFGSTYFGGFSHWIFGWMLTHPQSPPDDFWLWFWFRNTGWLFIVMIFGWYWLRRQKVTQEIWFFYLAGLGIFIISNLYIFQPTYWDNMKFFEYAFWFMMLVSAAIFSHWSRHTRGAIIAALLMISLTITGIYTLIVSGPRLTYELLSPDDVRFGNHLRQILPKQSFLLTTERHNNPVTMLGGGKVFILFNGWYNLYDDQWQQAISERDTMLGGLGNSQDLITRYGLTHAIFSDGDLLRGSVNKIFFDTNYNLISYENGWWVYDLRQRLTNDTKPLR